MKKITPENIQSLFEKSGAENALAFADDLIDNLEQHFDNPEKNLLEIITAIQKFRSENDQENKQYFNPAGSFCVKNGDFLEEGIRVGIEIGDETIYDKGIVSLWDVKDGENVKVRLNSERKRKFKFKTHPITIEFMPNGSKEEEIESVHLRWGNHHHTKTIVLGHLKSTYNGKTVVQPVYVSGTHLTLGTKEIDEKEFQSKTPQLDEKYLFEFNFSVNETFEDNPIVHIVSFGGNKKIRRMHFSTTCEGYYKPRDTVYEGTKIISFR